MEYEMMNSLGLSNAFHVDRNAYEKVIDLRKRPRDAQIPGPMKRRIVDKTSGPAILSTPTTPEATMPYGRSATPRVRRAVLRRKRPRRRARPTRKRVFTKRVKKVIDKLSEKHYKSQGKPSIGTTAGIASAATQYFFSTIPITGVAPNQVGGKGRWEFTAQYPYIGFQRLLRTSDFPLSSVGQSKTLDTYQGRKVEFTGISLTGLVELTAEARANASVKLHVLKMNINKWPNPSVPGSAVLQGSGNIHGLQAGFPTLTSDGVQTGYWKIVTKDNPVDGVALAAEDEFCLFDVNDGDRRHDVNKKRIGWFNHGYKLTNGITLVKTLVLDGMTSTATNNLSPSIVPFTFFIPWKKMYTNLDSNISQTATEQQLVEKAPWLFIAIEIVQRELDDSSIALSTKTITNPSGAKVCLNPARLHFNDHV
jgi:hypothetical protein